MANTPLPLIHNSEETAFLIESYPYGRLRCQKRVWLETKPGKGTRMVSRTSNPKRGNDWLNASKAGIYHDSAGLYLDENGHVQIAVGNIGYDDADKLEKYIADMGEQVTNLAQIKYAVKLKRAFTIEKEKAGNPGYGTPAYMEAYKAAKLAVGPQ